MRRRLANEAANGKMQALGEKVVRFALATADKISPEVGGFDLANDVHVKELAYLIGCAALTRFHDSTRQGAVLVGLAHAMGSAVGALAPDQVDALKAGLISIFDNGFAEAVELTVERDGGGRA